MLLKSTIFNDLNPGYRKIIEKFEQKYNSIPENENETKFQLLKDFHQNYLMLNDYWVEYFALISNSEWNIGEILEEKKYGEKKARYHFLNYRLEKLMWQNPFCREIHLGLQKPLTLDEILSDLSYPQKGMVRRLLFYQEHASRALFVFDFPLPKVAYLKFKKAEELYSKIVQVDNDDTKWFELITQVENEEFVHNNIDERLGKNLNNIQLWRLYIKYLKEQKNTERLLHLYSRYCRYFVDDDEMKQEYKEAVKIHGPSIVFWKNSFDFETYQSDPDLIVVCPSHLSFFHTNIHNIHHFTFDYIASQIFSLPKTIMSYIKNSCDPNVLHKLHKSCKYFFSTSPFPVCHNFILDDFSPNSIYFYANSVLINLSQEYKFKVVYNQKLIISNSFHISKENFISTTILNLYQCNAKYIRIQNQAFTFKELKFLVGHGNVKVLYLKKVHIMHENKKSVELEEILEMIPKIIEFRIDFPTINENTYKIISSLNFENKFQIFNLHYVPHIDAYDFCKFLKKNLDSDSRVVIRLADEVGNVIRKEAKQIVENELNNYWPKMPNIRFF